MEVLQIANKEKFNELKEWQAKAYLFVLLYSCLRCYGVHYHFGKIGRLYEAVGDIYEWSITDAILAEIHIATLKFIATNKHEDFATNLRLLPPEARQEIKDTCIPIIKSARIQTDKVLIEIINRELQ